MDSKPTWRYIKIKKNETLLDIFNSEVTLDGLMVPYLMEGINY